VTAGDGQAEERVQDAVGTLATLMGNAAGDGRLLLGPSDWRALGEALVRCEALEAFMAGLAKTLPRRPPA
jgi:hypothetical protein